MVGFFFRGERLPPVVLPRVAFVVSRLVWLAVNECDAPRRTTWSRCGRLLPGRRPPTHGRIRNFGFAREMMGGEEAWGRAGGATDNR